MYEVISRTATPRATAQPAPVSATRSLLSCGVLAGPLFIGLGLAQAFIRDGFDLSRHPLSLLSNGELGWLQIANFVVAGVLTIAFATGVRRVVVEGRGRVWGPRLLTGFGIGLITAGVFVADPADGYPPGTPPGMPEEFTWHSILHGAGAVVAFLSLVIACFVYARRFAARRERGWMWSSVVTGVVALLLSSWYGEGASIMLVIASAAGFGWLAALALRLRTGLSDI